MNGSVRWQDSTGGEVSWRGSDVITRPGFAAPPLAGWLLRGGGVMGTALRGRTFGAVRTGCERVEDVQQPSHRQPRGALCRSPLYAF